MVDLNWLLEHGSYIIILLYLIGAGLGLPLPEDLAMIAAGVLLQRQIVQPEPMIAVVFVGVLVGDMIIFSAARRWGPLAYNHPFIARLLPPSRRDKLEKLFDRWGGGVIFLARQMAGIRAPVFAMAGVHRMKPHLFLMWDFLALLVSAPLWMGLGYFFSDQLEESSKGIHEAKLYLGAIVLALLGGYLIYRHYSRGLKGPDNPDNPGTGSK